MENHEKYLKIMSDTLKKKNSDYSGDSNTYHNFMHCEELGLCSAEAGIMVRMSDKMARVATLLKQDYKVKEESIKDTLLDLSNYALILASYIEDKNKKN
jgi:hypothetical protein